LGAWSLIRNGIPIFWARTTEKSDAIAQCKEMVNKFMDKKKLEKENCGGREAVEVTPPAPPPKKKMLLLRRGPNGLKQIFG
jgi:hypothetical protein